MKVTQRISAFIIFVTTEFSTKSLLLNILFPVAHKLSDAIRKKLFGLSAKLVMHRFFHNVIICKSMTSESSLWKFKQIRGARFGLYA
jgi:hypothetical protein